MLVSTVSRLADLVTRRVSPANCRATELDLIDHGREVLTELVTTRAVALGAITDHMDAGDVQAVLTGAHAITTTRKRLTEPGGQ